MQPPDITYSYRWPKDVAGPTFEVFSRNMRADAAAGTVTVDIAEIPKDRILVAMNCTVQLIPGLGQAAIIGFISAFTQAGLEYRLMMDAWPVVANQTQVLNWQGGAYIAGRDAGETNMRLTGLFDAGAVVNFIELYVHGVVIPRGNAAAF